MDLKALKQFTDQTWDQSILPMLETYIGIPNKSPNFDKDWQARQIYWQRKLGRLRLGVEPLGAFVQRQREYKKWKVIGVALARPLDASRRVSRIQASAR